MSSDLPDPREFPRVADAEQSAVFALAQDSLSAPSTARADELDRTLDALIEGYLRNDRGTELALLFAAAPTADVARHLWRRLIAAWSDTSQRAAAGQIAVGVFVLPVVLVAGITDDGESRDVETILRDVALAASILKDGAALGGNQTFGLANALVATDAFDLANLPQVFAWQQTAFAAAAGERELTPAPIAVSAGQESVHLRFLVGTALAPGYAKLFAQEHVGTWGIPLAKELARQLATAGISLLALPRAPQSPPAALVHGRAAQREVGLQIFASNAIRRLRASVGEPVAIISAHRSPAAPGGGELRLSRRARSTRGRQRVSAVRSIPPTGSPTWQRRSSS